MADKDKKKKYLLYSSNDGRPSSMKPCAFFASDEGCKNGDKCKFSHTLVSESVLAPAPVPVIPPPTNIIPPTIKKEKVEVVKKNDERASSKRKHVEETVPSTPATTTNNAGSSSKKVKIEASDEISILREQLRKQQEMFEQRLASLSKEQPQQPQQQPPQQKSSVKTAFSNPLLIQQQQPQQHPFQVLSPLTTTTLPQPKSQQKKAQADVNKTVNNSASLFFSSSSSSVGSFQSQVNSILPAATSFAPPGLPMPTVSSTQAPVEPEEYETSDDDEKFLFNAVNHALRNSQELTPIRPVTPTAVVAKPNASVKKEKRENQEKATTLSSDFIFAPPEQPAAKETAVGKKEKRENQEKAAFVAATLSSDSIFVPPEQAAAKEDAAGNTNSNGVKQSFDFNQVDLRSLDWDNLMHITFNHKRYARDYTFAKDPYWVQARPSGEWCQNRDMPAVIAIDCEMCECADPVTGSRDKNALVRVSVINGLDPSQVFIDTLVSPILPIVDARTGIHGITEEQILGAKVTLRQAQAALLNIITEDTIIIGHSVCNDLCALRLDHKRCIDTAFLCPVENNSRSSLMGLRLIIEKLMGLKLPDTHDSVQDARAALLVAAYVGSRGTPVNLSFRDRDREDTSTQLMVHRIPLGCTEEDLRAMLLAYTHVEPVKISTITHNVTLPTDPTGKAYVSYASQKHLDLAFDSLHGPVRNDNAQRPQKRIYLKKGGYICVRK
eukprot:gene10385-11502_t